MMTLVTESDAERYETHGSRFDSYIRSSTGSTQLCAWKLTVPAGLRGQPHRPSHEEVLLVLDGDLQVTVDAVVSTAGAGDVVFVPAGAEFRVDGGRRGATAWVCTTPGLQAVTADGVTITPPWAQ